MVSERDFITRSDHVLRLKFTAAPPLSLSNSSIGSQIKSNASKTPRSSSLAISSSSSSLLLAHVWHSGDCPSQWYRGCCHWNVASICPPARFRWRAHTERTTSKARWCSPCSCSPRGTGRRAAALSPASRWTAGELANGPISRRSPRLPGKEVETED